ncbi:MAG: hypothetical protein HZC28_13935 [Spirochaetes bacterium]|nr:hypothetical protein [Spirochaetota bacterium]
MKTPMKKNTLHDMGGGLLYDEVQDITWLQDANYVQTSGYKSNGKLSWRNANAWAAQLVYHDPVRNKDITGWRLPRVSPVSGKMFNGRFSFDGSTDEGYNNVSPRSELAYMFYVNLGMKGYYSPSGGDQSAVCGPAGNGQRGYVVNAGPVKNLMSYIYWTGTAVEPYVDRNAWMFDAQYGFQNFYNQNDMLCPWAVHDGNVTGVDPANVAQSTTAHDDGQPAVTIVSPPSTVKELDTFTEIMKDIRCEFPFNNCIGPDEYWRMWDSMELFVGDPSLAAFWTFGEPKGPRRSIICGKPYPLDETGGTIERKRGGPFSGFAGRFDGTADLCLSAEAAAAFPELSINDGVTVFTVVRLDDITSRGALLVDTGAGASVRLTVATDVPAGEWVTIAVCRTADGDRYYLNGKRVHGVPAVTGPAAATFTIAGPTTGPKFTGRIGAVALFRRGLRDEEMMDLHRAAHTEILQKDYAR